MTSTAAMQSAAGKPEDFPGMTVGKFFELIKSKFPEEEKQEVELECILWNSMFSSVIENVGRRERDKSLVRSTCTEEHVINQLKTKKYLRISHAREVMDIWLG